MYVGDVVKANVAAAERRLAGVFNIGTGIETSVNELYDRVAEACGVSAHLQKGAPPSPGSSGGAS